MAAPIRDRPASLKLVLSCERENDVVAPDQEDVLNLIFCLEPSEGLGFACLAEAGGFGDYVQVAGGFDQTFGCARYCVERRIYVRNSDDHIVSPDDYRHLVAGVPVPGPHTKTSVRTNGFKVACNTNEVLFVEDVIAIFFAFMETRNLPEDLEWRSNRSEVDEIGELSRN